MSIGGKKNMDGRAHQFTICLGIALSIALLVAVGPWLDSRGLPARCAMVVRALLAFIAAMAMGVNALHETRSAGSLTGRMALVACAISAVLAAIGAAWLFVGFDLIDAIGVGLLLASPTVIILNFVRGKFSRHRF